MSASPAQTDAGAAAAGDPSPAGPGGPRTRRQDVAAAAILLLVGAGAAVAAWRLEVGEPADPGPGMWPLLAAVAMTALAGSLVLRPPASAQEDALTRRSLVVVAAVASLLGYALLFERVGFEAPTAALLILWLRAFGREPWPVTLAVTAGATAAAYVLFIIVLGVSLPHVVQL